MKVFKDYKEILDTPENLDKYIQNLIQFCEGKDTYSYSKDNDKISEDYRSIVFYTKGLPSLPNAKISVLLKNKSSELWIANINPLSLKSNLSYDQYNSILGLFKKDVLDKCKKDFKIEIQESDSEISLSKKIPKSYTFLNSFMAIHNFSHPNDIERWQEFICSMIKHKEYSVIDSDLLIRGIEEDFNCHEDDLLERISLQYENDIDLILYFQQHENVN